MATAALWFFRNRGASRLRFSRAANPRSFVWASPLGNANATILPVKTLSYLLPPPAAITTNCRPDFSPDVGRGSGEAARRQHCRPKFLPGIAIKGAKLSVAGGRDENQAPVRDDGATDVGRAGLRDTTLLQLVEFAQSGPPANVAGVEIHGVERAPGRLLTRITILRR